MDMKIEIAAVPEENITPEQAEQQGCFTGFAKAVRAMMDKCEGHWGWCTVIVTVTFLRNGKWIKGNAFLGECSYESVQDFADNSSYLQSMITEAIADAQ